MYFDAPFDPPDAPDAVEELEELRPSLTQAQDEFMLLCRDEVERNGPLDGNTYVEKLGLNIDTKKKVAKRHKSNLRLLTVYSPTLLRLDADFCLELARELLRSEL